MVGLEMHQDACIRDWPPSTRLLITFSFFLIYNLGVIYLSIYLVSSYSMRVNPFKRRGVLDLWNRSRREVLNLLRCRVIGTRKRMWIPNKYGEEEDKGL